MLRRFTSLCVLLMLCGMPLEAQTLAHPGWHGNGIASQAWWKHASFVRFGADTTFAGVAHSLDAMAEAGVDTMILPDLQPAADAPVPFSERFGTEDDLDALLREASARRMHVLLTMPVARLSAGGGEVRFWMSRGIAGFDVGIASAGDLSVLRGVRSAMARFPGGRILLARSTPEVASRPVGRDPITLHLVTENELGRYPPSQPSAIEIADLPSLNAWFSSGTVPIFAGAMLSQAEDRSRISSALARRARVASRAHRL